MMRVLALCSYPVEAAATRFRLTQFVGPLGERGIELTIRPFLTSSQFGSLYSKGSLISKAAAIVPSVGRRFRELFESRKFDMLLVQREAMLFGPGIFEWLHRSIGNLPMVLDLDDATYVRYQSPNYGRLADHLKFFGKTDRLIARSKLVVCGNRFIAEYAASKGVRAEVIPTIADTDIFRPLEKQNEIPVLGWIGTHSTFPFLESIFPVLERLAEKHRFRLKIVGSGRPEITIKNVEIENLDWSLDREVDDFRSLDIGLYPIVIAGAADENWIKGKSGFKAIQYMAVGVPFVVTPVGVSGEMGEPGVTHLNASTAEDWYNCLNTLLSDTAGRRRMGAAGREFSVEHYNVPVQAELLADALRSVVQKG